MGIVCGGVARAFLEISCASSTAHLKKSACQFTSKLALAGLVAGVIAMAISRHLRQRLLRDQRHFAAATTKTIPTRLPQLGGLFLLKLLVTAVAVGAGTVGGVFTPTLFLGATSARCSAWRA